MFQTKTQLLIARIKHVQAKATGKLYRLDSPSYSPAPDFLDEKLENLTPDQYTTKLNTINQIFETCKSKITDTEELTWIEYYSSQLDQLEGVVSQYQDKLLNLEELQVLNSYQHQLVQLSGEVSNYFKEVQDIVSGGLAEDSPLMKQLESKIGHYPEFGELQKIAAELEQVKKIPEEQEEQFKSYQDMKKIKRQAEELGNKHFSEQQDKLRSAQQKLASFKKKYSSVQTTKDMSTAVKRNSLEGKPLGERLVLGGNFQINPPYSKTAGSTSTGGTTSSSGSTSRIPTSVYVSPLLGYRLNKKLTLGVGATYRAILEIDEFEAKDQVYGYRGFVQQGAYKGLFIHGEYENLSAASTTFNTSGEVSRNWQPGALTGIGKEFTLFKQVKGQVMILYNFLYEDGSSSYQKPWVIRFGFVR